MSDTYMHALYLVLLLLVIGSMAMTRGRLGGKDALKNAITWLAIILFLVLLYSVLQRWMPH